PNAFTVQLALGSQYGGRAVEMRATVLGSTQPVEQVEFYKGPSFNGPFELIGRNFGPDYVIFRTFPAAEQPWLRARAVDVYGNITDSVVRQFLNLQDITAPDATFTVTGELIGA